MENRNGLCVGVAAGQANGFAERIQSFAMLDHVYRRHRLCPKTLGADAGYRDGLYLEGLESRGIMPHVPMGEGKIASNEPAAQARRRAHAQKHTTGYTLSQRVRKRVEEIFGWCKSIGGMARSRFVGRWKFKQQCEITAAAYNLLRMTKLAPTTRLTPTT